MKRVIVTGGTGFIGRQTLSILKEQGYEIHVLTSKTQKIKELYFNSMVNYHICNLHDFKDTRDVVNRIGAEYLLHFAWYVEHGDFWESSKNIDWANATINLYEAFIESGGKRAVFSGTCAEYSWKGGYLNEANTPLIPLTVYGKTKLDVSRKIDEISKQTGCTHAWGRIFLPFGPYENIERLTPKIITSMIKGEQVLISNPTYIRDFIYVKDVARAFVYLLNHNFTGPINIGSGVGTKIVDYVYSINELLGGREHVKFKGAISRDEPETIAADVRLLNLIGFEPLYTPTRALEETIYYWQRILGAIDGRFRKVC